VSAKTLLTGGCVLTLGAKTPNFARADVLMDGGVITEVGPGIRARDAEPVDASDTIVMPGFVDTHRHAARSLFRNLGGPISGGPDLEPGELAGHYRPDDVYAATMIGLLGAAEAGITTVVDWSDAGSDAAADAALQAHADAGLRTVFVQAASGRGSVGPSTPQVEARPADAAVPASTTFAFGSAAPRSSDVEAIVDGWGRAREAGLRIHAHAGRAWERGVIASLGERKLLGPDVTLVHCSALQDADVEAIASSGAAVSLSPSSEMAGGSGPPPIQLLIDRDVRPGLGIDEERVTPGDMFAQMRETISLQHATVFDRKLAGKAGLPRLMSTRDVIRFATIDGARVAGLAGVTGSLEPGMRADVIVLRTDRPNVFPINDPIGAVVWGMDTSNVDRVYVDGRALMVGGALVADVARARGLATEARDRVAAAAGIVVSAGHGGAG
jgi:cytosine/adenosine deaminase-related metal-dependent hydrolase